MYHTVCHLIISQSYMHAHKPSKIIHKQQRQAAFCSHRRTQKYKYTHTSTDKMQTQTLQIKISHKIGIWVIVCTGTLGRYFSTIFWSLSITNSRKKIKLTTENDDEEEEEEKMRTWIEKQSNKMSLLYVSLNLLLSVSFFLSFTLSFSFTHAYNERIGKQTHIYIAFTIPYSHIQFVQMLISSTNALQCFSKYFFISTSKCENYPLLLLLTTTTTRSMYIVHVACVDGVNFSIVSDSFMCDRKAKRRREMKKKKKELYVMYTNIYSLTKRDNKLDHCIWRIQKPLRAKL